MDLDYSTLTPKEVGLNVNSVKFVENSYFYYSKRFF